MRLPRLFGSSLRLTAVVCVLFLAAGAAAAERPFMLLELDGRYLKWGDAHFGRGARVTWAMLDRPRSRSDAINCREMLPIDVVLKGSAISRRTFRRETRRALATWSEVADLRFEEVGSVGRADIVIGTQRGRQGVAFTDVTPAPQGSQEIGAPKITSLRAALICLDASERFETGYDGDDATYNLHHVLAHELGHALGLDHPGRFGALMAYGYRETDRGRALGKLTPGDQTAIRKLYGPAKK